jgi:nucleotide-binding universal stress UspA family protein
MTRALVAVDGSASSIHAARRATLLLGPSTAFTVLHVLEPPVPGVSARIADPVLFQQLLDDADERSQRTLAAAADAVGGHARRLGVRAMDPGRVICDVAAEEQADVVVVGTKGAGGIRRALIGSTSLHVVNHAGRPVLVVGGETAGEPS